MEAACDNNGRIPARQLRLGLVTLAHLRTQGTRNQSARRYRAKYRLIRLLYGKGWAKSRIIQLLRIIDWLMALPPHLEQSLRQRITAIEGETHMQYVTSFERLAREEGVQEGVQKGIEKARFKTARNLIAETDMDDATIAELTDLTEDQVRLLRSA